MTVWHSHHFRQGRIPGHLASRDGSARDAGQMGSIPGRPGQSGTGGNPIIVIFFDAKFLISLMRFDALYFFTPCGFVF